MTSRDLWEESIAVFFCFIVCLVTFFTTTFKRRGGGRERRVVVRPGVADDTSSGPFIVPSRQLASC